MHMPASRQTGTPTSKTCHTCGRTIEWRKKWQRDWEQVRYCSDGCRRSRRGDEDRALESTILELLARRGAGKTICPSEAARLVAARALAPGIADAAREAWEPLMEPARAAARRLTAAGRIVMMQGGQVVDPSHAKGPIRLKLV
jgi:hypothetical protein